MTKSEFDSFISKDGMFDPPWLKPGFAKFCEHLSKIGLAGLGLGPVQFDNEDEQSFSE